MKRIFVILIVLTLVILTSLSIFLGVWFTRTPVEPEPKVVAPKESPKEAPKSPTPVKRKPSKLRKRRKQPRKEPAEPAETSDEGVSDETLLSDVAPEESEPEVSPETAVPTEGAEDGTPTPETTRPPQKLDIPIVTMDFDISDGSHEMDGYALIVSTSEMDEFAGYTKTTFSTPTSVLLKSFLLEHMEVEIKDRVFVEAKVYGWMRFPLLLIITTVGPEEGASETLKHYYTNGGPHKIGFVKYDTEEDLEANPVELLKLLDELNALFHNIIPLDIGKVPSKLRETVSFPGIAKVLETVVTMSPESHCNEVTTRFFPFFTMPHFKVSEVTQNGTPVQITLPSEAILKVTVFMWNSTPLLLMFRGKSKFHYYIPESANNWIPLTDNNVPISTELTKYELETELEFVNTSVNNILLLNLNQEKSYHYYERYIHVSKGKIQSKNAYDTFIHQVLFDDFVVGGYYVSNIFIRELPVGMTLNNITVYKHKDLPIFIKMEVVVNKKSKMRYFAFTKGSVWKELTGKESENIEHRLGIELDIIASYVGQPLTLDIGKKASYVSKKSHRRESVEVGVKFETKKFYFHIFSHRPVSTAASQDGKADQMFAMLNLTFDGREVGGIPPALFQTANVYLLDGLNPVAVDIDTGFGRLAYAAKPGGQWTRIFPDYSNFTKSLTQYDKYSRSVNQVCSIDIGMTTSYIAEKYLFLVTRSNFSDYIRFEHQCSLHIYFLLDSIMFRTNKYDFDTAPLFMDRFLKAFVYYTPDTMIPVMFMLVGKERNLVFYMDLEGRWTKLKSSHDDDNLILVCKTISGVLNHVINLNNYEDYSTGGVEVMVKKTVEPEKFFKYTHTPKTQIPLKGLVHMGMKIPEFGDKLENVVSVSAYFVLSYHNPLAIELQTPDSTKTFVNVGDGTWKQLNAPITPADIDSAYVRLTGGSV